MLITEADKKWTEEIERRKRQIIEEEQMRLNVANFRRCPNLIFSHIFQITRKLKKNHKVTRRKLRRRIFQQAEKLEVKADVKVKASKTAPYKIPSPWPQPQGFQLPQFPHRHRRLQGPNR